MRVQIEEPVVGCSVRVQGHHSGHWGVPGIQDQES